MKYLFSTMLISVSMLISTSVQADILAMVSYETKSADSLKSLKVSPTRTREEGIAILQVDPESADFGKILWQMPLPSDLMAHHIFYDRTMKKAYMTSLAKKELYILDFSSFPIRHKIIPVNCVMGEDVVMNEDNTRWYLTCMGSANVIVGDIATDEVVAEISVPDSYPHGLALNSDINRILVTSTIKGDLTDAREVITEVDATTYEVLGTHKMSNKPSPSGVAPVEILFVPGAETPTAYVSNMFGGTLWTATWNGDKKTFDTNEAYDFNTSNSGVPLEIYFSQDAKRMYSTSAAPGRFHIFDISENVGEPKLVKTIGVGDGAHHVGLTKDGRYGVVQSSFLNLPGMSSGTISVIDLKTEELVGTITSLSDAGYNPNVIVLLPKWNIFGGH